MNLHNILQRKSPPSPWQEGDNIPWFEAGFSKRMLKEHLTQEHDLASRRQMIIEQHVNWIHEDLLSGERGSILDLGCGPGLYTYKLAERGHTCLGIDYSPASVTYARDTARDGGQVIEYHQEDVRSAEYGVSYDLVMMLFGEFNVFQPSDGEHILEKAYQALKPGGLLLLEPHLYEDVKKVERSAFTWYSAQSGLFSDAPHICLEESYWDEQLGASTHRYFIIDTQTGEVSQYSSSMQAYTGRQYFELLQKVGFNDVHILPNLGSVQDSYPGDLIAITARK